MQITLENATGNTGKQDWRIEMNRPTWWLILAAALFLSGCSGLGLSGPANTVTTTYDLDGKPVLTQANMSDDAAYYDAAARYYESKNAGLSCEGCTPDQKIIQILAIALTDKGFVARGMNGYEFAAKVSGDIVNIAPYGAIGAVAIRGIKSAGDISMGENAVYAPANAVGTGNTITIPLNSPPTTTTTTYAPQ